MKSSDTLLETLGVTFKNSDLLALALTHSSRNLSVNNERLEFLGDRVLSLAIAEKIYVRFPDEHEGALALRHAALVRAETLADIAREIGLGDYLTSAGTSDLDNVLADGLEALIGAVYLDAGFPACQKLVERLWGNRIVDMKAPPQDPKTMLQEWAQARGGALPDYEIVGREGPDHAPEFKIRVSVAGLGMAEATGPSRRIAEKRAAEILLSKRPSKS